MDKTAYFEQMRRRRRNEILTAAREMILKQGVSTFNIQQLARSLDISTVTLYKYFKNADDIILALKEQIIDEAFGMPLFMEQTTVNKNALDSALKLLNNFYNEVLKSRGDVTLLLLFEVHTRSLPSPDEDRNVFYAYTEKLNKRLEELLTLAKENGDTRADLNVPEAVHFIARMNISMLEHIGLYSDDCFEKDEEAVHAQIEQLIQMYSLFLTFSACSH